MDLKGRGWEGVDWLNLAQDRDKWWVFVSRVMNLQVTYSGRNMTS
jgi:hypothetical protein